MGIIEEKITRIGFILPQLPTAAGLYSPAIRSGNQVCTSGQLPLLDGKLVEPGGKGRLNASAVSGKNISSIRFARPIMEIDKPRVLRVLTLVLTRTILVLTRTK